MTNMRRSIYIRILALALTIVFAFPSAFNAKADEVAEPFSSSYIYSYNSTIGTTGAGKITVSFSVNGISQMDDIGATYIRIYESTDNSTWTWVQDYNSAVTTSLMGHNKSFHSGSVSYQGVAGRYYKAYVCIYAGKNGSGDSRYLWTSAKQAA